MSAPRWARGLLTRLAGPDRADEVVGDLEEAHGRRLVRHGRIVANALTTLETVDMAWALLRRRRRRATDPRSKRWRSPVSWLDVKLSARMLRKHPGLTAVSVIGMAVGVAIGATVFGVIRGLTASPLPLDGGDRVVAVQNITAFGFDMMEASHLHALEAWRAGAPSLENLGAYRHVMRNLITSDGGVAPERVVEMSAAGFRIARVPPLLGRYLVDGDEEEGAPAVVVIGYGVWHDRFGGAPDVVGRSLQIGATPHVVVGVMPRGFAFPINDRVWTPLRLDPDDYPLGGAPPVQVFARLVPGATIESAGLEVEGVAQRLLEAMGSSGRGVGGRVYPYTEGGVWGPVDWLLYMIEAVVSLVLVVIAINVAALVYARTVSRVGEITVRSALGASRARIVGQLFTEAFLMSSLAAGVGLFAASAVLKRVSLSMASRPETPFWWDFSLSSEAVVYGFGLAVVAAVIIGVVPALGATGRRLLARLQNAGSGVSGPRLGRTWTTLIVLQIAAAVAILPLTVSFVARHVSSVGPESALPLDEVVVAKLALDQDPAEEVSGASWQARYDLLREELLRRLEARPEIARVALMGTPPWLDPDVRFEVDGGAAGPRAGSPSATGSASSGHAVGRSTVAPEFFEVLDVPVLAGRLPTRNDAVAGPTSIVVNETFEELILGGGSAVGRRLRFPQPVDPRLGNRSALDGTGQPWYTIVGVVPNFHGGGGVANPEAKAYLPLLTAHEGPVHVALRVRADDAGGFAGRFRRIVADVDPMLRLEGVETLAARSERAGAGTPTMLVMIVGVATAVLLLAIAGLYALMSFTVARRHREIGIRVALGARPLGVLSSILLGALRQLTIGVVLGLVFASVFDRLLGGETLGRQEYLILPAVAILMMLVGVLAAWGPARRGLGVEPTVALRVE